MAERASMSERPPILTASRNAQDIAQDLSPVIDKIIAEYNQAHALYGLMALYERLREVCGPDTAVHITCVGGESHLHVTTFSTCKACD